MFSFKRFFGFLCVAVLVSGSVLLPVGQADELVLVKDGKSQYTIVIPAKAVPAEVFAASELQRYLHKMTGTQLPLVNEEEQGNGPVVSVGATKQAERAAAVPRRRYPQDGSYRLYSAGPNIHVVGCSPRGTLYAVYDMLERLGCRWFAPGYDFYKGMNDLVPKRDDIVITTPLDVTEKPDFKVRAEFPEHYFLHGPDNVVALVDWCAKNRINTFSVRLNEFTDPWYRVLEPECSKRDLMLIADAHGFERFLPRDVYFPDHPEWFGPVNGKYSDHYFDQFRVGHPEAIKTFTANLREFVRKYPKLYALSAMPNDSPRWADTDMAEHTAVEILFRMYDQVVKTVYETNPDMKVYIGTGVTYFGQEGTEIYDPPCPNVVWHTAVLRRTQKYAWNDPASELNYSQYQKAAEVTRKLVAQGADVVWDSRYCPFRDISLPGLVYPHQMAAELRDLKKIGGTGVNFNYAVPPAWIPYELKHHIYARLMWDTSESVDDIMNTYYKERFPGSPAEIKGFYTALRRAMERYEHPGGGYTREQADGLYPEDKFEEGFSDMDEAREFIDKAMAANPSDAEKQIIWLLGASLQHGRNKMELDHLAQTGRIDEAKEKVAEMTDYLERWDGKGINYDSSFLRTRLEYRFLSRREWPMPIKKGQVKDGRVYEFKDYLPDERP